MSCWDPSQRTTSSEQRNRKADTNLYTGCRGWAYPQDLIPPTDSLPREKTEEVGAAMAGSDVSRGAGTVAASGWVPGRNRVAGTAMLSAWCGRAWL